MDMNGNALTRYAVDETAWELQTQDIVIVCGRWGFRKIKDLYEGWLGVPYVDDFGHVVMEGVHPVSMKKFTVTCGDEEQVKFLGSKDGRAATVAEIFNYSTSC